MGSFCPGYKITTSIGNDKYPSDMTEAYNIMNHYMRDTKYMQYFDYSEEVDLSQEYGGSGGNGNKKKTCWRCKLNYTSIPEDLCRMKIVLMSQKKRTIVTRIIRDLGKVRK